MGDFAQAGEIHYSTRGRVPTVELLVPQGTSLADLAGTLKLISTEINPKISPIGCQACTSGTHLIIREMFENVVRVDLKTGQIIK